MAVLGNAQSQVARKFKSPNLFPIKNALNQLSPSSSNLITYFKSQCHANAKATALHLSFPTMNNALLSKPGNDFDQLLPGLVPNPIFIFSFILIVNVRGILCISRLFF